MILKPTEETPLTALRLGELIQEAGFPRGVVNIVTGLGETAGAALSHHADVDKIAFTGSTEVGRKVIAASAGNLKRVSLDLGGKSPMIVLPGADLDAVVNGTSIGILFNAGQSCMAASRLHVHRSVFDQVVGGIAARAERLVGGDGFAPDSQIGPLVSETQLKRVMGYIRPRNGSWTRPSGLRYGELARRDDAAGSLEYLRAAHSDIRPWD